MVGQVKKLTKKSNIDLNIRYKQVKNDICIYQVKVSFGDVLLKNIVRLCYASELEELCNNTIAFSNMKHRTLDNYRFYKADIKEAMRENCENMFNEEYILDMEDILDEKVDISNAVLGKKDFYNDNFYEYDNNIPIPKSVHFDYINGNVHNGNYHLETILKILENRKDITINKDKYTFAIRDIPYYNANYNKDMYIDFIWHPTDEDWKAYVKSPAFNSWGRYEYVLKNIFKLPLKKNLTD